MTNLALPVLIGVFQFSWILGRPELVGSGRPRGPRRPSQKVGPKPPTFWEGFPSHRGRPASKNRRFPAGPQIQENGKLSIGSKRRPKGTGTGWSKLTGRLTHEGGIKPDRQRQASGSSGGGHAPGVRRQAHGSRRRKHFGIKHTWPTRQVFNSTLGFPGEGPEGRNQEWGNVNSPAVFPHNVQAPIFYPGQLGRGEETGAFECGQGQKERGGGGGLNQARRSRVAQCYQGDAETRSPWQQQTSRHGAVSVTHSL
jgi:hypothetical protein